MALTGYLLVQPDQLAAQASAVEQGIHTMQDDFSELERLIRSTTSFWDGEAARFHRERYTQQKDKIDEMLRRYREHVADLRAMAGIYNAAEQAARKAVDELPASNLD